MNPYPLSWYQPGTANAVSDQSGFVYKRKDMRLTWDNFLVGDDEWYPKQPQMIIRPRKDIMYTPNPRPDNNNNEVLGPIIQPNQYI